MAVSVASLKFYFSGGSSNSDPKASIGNAISSTEIPLYQLNGLMDRVDEDESEIGATNYRIIYFRNTSSQTAYNVKVFFDQDATNKKRDPSGTLISPAVNDPITYNSEVTMALYAGNLNATATKLINESTNVSPSPVYTSAQGAPNALLIGDMNTTDYKAIILKRTIAASTPAKDINHILISITAGTGE